MAGKLTAKILRSTHGFALVIASPKGMSAEEAEAGMPAAIRELQLETTAEEAKAILSGLMATFEDIRGALQLLTPDESLLTSMLTELVLAAYRAWPHSWRDILSDMLDHHGTECDDSACVVDRVHTAFKECSGESY